MAYDVYNKDMPRSRLSYDFARQNRPAPQFSRRKKKFNTPIFKLPTWEKPKILRDRDFTPEVEPERETKTIILHFIISLMCGLLLLYIVYTFYPNDIKNLGITNSYLAILVPFFFCLYYLLKAFSLATMRSFFVSLFITVLLFFKLQAVIFEISLILPLFFIFVIIDMLYSNSYIDKFRSHYANFSQNSKPKHRRHY